jgi:hypothetical protein
MQNTQYFMHELGTGVFNYPPLLFHTLGHLNSQLVWENSNSMPVFRQKRFRIPELTSELPNSSALPPPSIPVFISE